MLRPSDREPANVVTALLKRLIDALRQAWPKVRIVLRGDSRFCRPRVLQRYCARGEAENRIKEAQLDLFGRRASCHRFWANQLRLLLAALAYTLMINLRRHGLAGTELANACTATIRVWHPATRCASLLLRLWRTLPCWRSSPSARAADAHSPKR